jgi:hypothetical protein
MTNDEGNGPFGGRLFRQPPTGFRIEKLWAFVAVDPADTNEGIVAMENRGITMPLIASDRVRLAELRPYAQRVATQLGVVVKLVEFAGRLELETLHPSPLAP